jgi:FecR protein
MGHLSNFRFLALTGTMLALAGSFTPARAQDPDDLKRGVARISLINGDISVRRGDSGDWVAGVINAPLLTDDRIATGPSSRAEVQFDASNLLRLGANAELRLTQLEYGRYQMELARGVMTYRMLRTSDGNVEVDTPSLSVRPSRQGSFRISVNEAGETEVTARNGDVEVFTPHGSQWVHNGQTLMARGAAGDAEFQVVAATAMDDWDRWSDNRDRTITQSVSARYVGAGVYGTEDLDAAGSWASVPEYGNVWRPNVGPDWAPYQSGRWVWEDWYGWTWVSYDPWGWAPYHYGRWFHQANYGWCWYPGLITGRHYWSPALVGFFGFGGGGGIGFGFGNVGWVPLAPFEVFHPWWGRGYYGNRGFNRSLNITNVNITNVYRNAQYRNGISAVGANDFQNGRFQNVMRTSGAQVGSAGVIHGQMPFTGGAANQRFSDRQATVIPRGTQSARFFTHQQPNPVQRSQASGMQFGGRQTTQQAVPQNNRGQAAPQNNDAGGWRRFGSPSGQPAGQGNQPAANRNGSVGTGQAQRPSATPQSSQPSAPRNDSRGGWQRFGTPAGGNSAPNQGQGAAPRQQDFRSSPGGQSPSLRIAPPVVRERPSYNAPRQQSAPSYSAPRQQSAPAPRSNGGGSAPRGSSGGNSGGGSHNNHGR